MYKYLPTEVILIYNHQLEVDLVDPSLNPQIGDLMIEFQVRRVYRGLPRDHNPTVN